MLQGRISHIYNIPNRCLSNLSLKPSNTGDFPSSLCTAQCSLQILNDPLCPELFSYNLSHSPIKFNLLICSFKGSAQLWLHLSLVLYECVFAGCLGAFALLLISYLSCISLLTYILHPPISLSPSVWRPFAQKLLHQAFIFTFRKNFPLKVFSFVNKQALVHLKMWVLKDIPLLPPPPRPSPGVPIQPATLCSQPSGGFCLPSLGCKLILGGAVFCPLFSAVLNVLTALNSRLLIAQTKLKKGWIKGRRKGRHREYEALFKAVRKFRINVSCWDVLNTC